MLYRMTLQAGQYNSVNGKGRYFYLLTAADQVRVKFLDRATSTVDLTTDLREGMAAEFPLTIDEFQIVSDTAQYVEFWLSNTRLDYSRLAGGGSAANVNGGTVFCPAGKTLAIPADFRRKAVSIKVSDVCQIGGLDVDLFNGFTLEPNEKIKADSRGDIWVYREPAKVTIAAGAVEKSAPKWQDFVTPPSGLDYEINAMKKLSNGILVAHKNEVPIWSDDDGLTWTSCRRPDDVRVWGCVWLETDEDAVYVSEDFGRIYKITDGKTLEHVVTVQQSVLTDGTPVDKGQYFGVGDAGGSVSDDGQTIVYASYNLTFVSFNGGNSWRELPIAPIEQCRNAFISQDRKKVFLAFADSLYYYDLTKEDGWFFCFDRVELGNQNSIAFVGDNGFCVGYDRGASKVCILSSGDGGETWSVFDKQLPETLNYISRVIAIGATVIFSGKNEIGVISDSTKSAVISWYSSGIVLAEPESDHPTAIHYDKTDQTINVFQGGVGMTPTTTIISYPIEVAGGYLDGVTVSWLAEIN
ncbi:hypothetical protein [Shewanella sp. SR43-8]|uniref:WD40/YVTN/BNR-like repeat-containing protein n=1 Tax=Shewanella sp. SR43-8 TaxID=2760938 RepID=UPI0016047D5C|nr:hypothetical protein [Shewanella sp. SR43-8]MBB1322118.1 hypothetical protein [Shewanella sp. SR43-8]